MADSSPKPGQTVNPQSTDNEMAVKIDHGTSVAPSESTKPAEPAPAQTVAAEAPEQPAEAPEQPPQPEQVQSAESTPQDEVNDPVMTQQSAPDEEAMPEEVESAEFEDQAEPEGFNFVNEIEEGQREPVTGEYQWTASEYIAHEKTAGWYVVLFLLAAVLAGATFYFTKDKVSIFIIFFAAFVFAYFASHKPREMNYAITPDGVTVGNKQYRFDDFKSFGLVPEGAFTSIIFMPHKRFAIPITIYYPPESETKIAELIGNYLPFEEHSKDAIDRLLRAVRF